MKHPLSWLIQESRRAWAKAASPHLTNAERRHAFVEASRLEEWVFRRKEEERGVSCSAELECEPGTLPPNPLWQADEKEKKRKGKTL